jgi:hypothetical protein
MRKPTHTLVLAAILAAPATSAGVSITLDAQAINELLPALAVDDFVVPLAAGASMTLRVESLEVTAFEPAAAGSGSGRILTAARIGAPQLGLSLPVRPALSLHVVRDQGAGALELRFERAELTLPLRGTIDVGPFLPRLRLPADNVWQLPVGSEEVEVHSRLTGVTTGENGLRFEFEVDVPAAPAGP